MMRWTLVTFLLVSFLFGFAADASACWSPKKPERQLASLTNRTRDNHEKRVLKFDDDLSKAARVQSKRMARRGLLFHNDYDSMNDLIGGTWALVGENVGNGSVLREIQGAFMHSPDHRRNVLYKTWRKVGVGVIRKDDRFWVTVLFASTGTVEAKVGGSNC